MSKLKIANTNSDFMTGMTKGNQDSYLFPFGIAGYKNMTMKDMSEPLLYKGYTNGNMTDFGVVGAGQESFKVNGDTVVEKRLKNLNFNESEKMNNKTYTGIVLRHGGKIEGIRRLPKAQFGLEPFDKQSDVFLDYLKSIDVIRDDSDIQPLESKSVNLHLPTDELNKDSFEVNNNITDNSLEGLDTKANKSKMIMGDTLQVLPINATYNLIKYLTQPATVEKPINNPYAFDALGIQRNMNAEYNLNPIFQQKKETEANINNNVTSGASKIAALMQNNNNVQNLLSNILQNQKEKNNNYQSIYANALYNEGAARAAEDKRVYENNLQHEAQRDDYLDTAIQEYGKSAQATGKVLNQRAQDALQLDMLKNQSKYFTLDKDNNITLTEFAKQAGLDVEQAKQIMLDAQAKRKLAEEQAKKEAAEKAKTENKPNNRFGGKITPNMSRTSKLITYLNSI